MKCYYYLFVLLAVSVAFSQKLGEKCNKIIKTAILEDTLEEICSKSSRYSVCCPYYLKTKLRPSVQKCFEYADAVSQIRNIQSRSLIGGSKTVPTEFSHMAALGYKNGNSIKWHCGGTLISDQYVLTAAHCSKNREYLPVHYVRLGDEANGEIYKIKEFIMHPDFAFKRKPYDDIALIKLHKKVQFSKHIHPACLYTDKIIESDKLTALGWGPEKTNDFSYDDEDNDNLKGLMKVELDLYSDEECQHIYGFKLLYGILPESQFCAGGRNDVRDTCKGDSGGPLILPSEHHKSLYYIVGVTSSGVKCGQFNTPGIYMRVSHYIRWIESVVWP